MTLRIPDAPPGRSITTPNGWLAFSGRPLIQGSPDYMNFVATLPLIEDQASFSASPMCRSEGGPVPGAALWCTRVAHDDGPHVATVAEARSGTRVRVVAVWVDPS